MCPPSLPVQQQAGYLDCFCRHVLCDPHFTSSLACFLLGSHVPGQSGLYLEMLSLMMEINCALSPKPSDFSLVVLNT